MSAKAEPVLPAEDPLEQAGECMVMLLPLGLWQAILLQGKAEGCPPGVILSKALKAYFEEHASEETMNYLKRLGVWDASE